MNLLFITLTSAEPSFLVVSAVWFDLEYYILLLFLFTKLNDLKYLFLNKIKFPRLSSISPANLFKTYWKSHLILNGQPWEIILYQFVFYLLWRMAVIFIKWKWKQYSRICPKSQIHFEEKKWLFFLFGKSIVLLSQNKTGQTDRQTVKGENKLHSKRMKILDSDARN